MSAEPIVITLSTEAGNTTTLPVVLKKIMEMPPPNILDGDDGRCNKVEGRKKLRCRLKTSFSNYSM